MTVLKSPRLYQFETASVATFGTVDDKSWEDLSRLVGLVMNDLDTLTDLEVLNSGAASQLMNALATRFLLKKSTSMFKELVCKVPLHTHQLRTSHAADPVVKSKFSDSSGADDVAKLLFRQNLQKRKDLGQR